MSREIRLRFKDKERVLLVLSLLLAFNNNPLLAEIAKFEEKIPFYGGYLIGYEQSKVPFSPGPLAWRDWTPMKVELERREPLGRDLIYIVITLEITSPFSYYAGMFRELTLVDENGKTYHWNGLPMYLPGLYLPGPPGADFYIGWAHIDEVNVDKQKPVCVFVVPKGEQSAYIPITFVVPTSSKEIRLRLKEKERVLFSTQK